VRVNCAGAEAGRDQWVSPIAATIRLVALYELRPDSLTALPRTTFADREVLERRDLQRLLRDQAQIIADDVMIVSEVSLGTRRHGTRPSVLERDAEEGSDQDDEAEDGNVARGWATATVVIRSAATKISKPRSSGLPSRNIRRASELGDSIVEHAIYAVDAILDYPQSGERFRERATIASQRGGHPTGRHFELLRIVRSGLLWVSECIITYDGAPTHSVSVMEFIGAYVAHEAQYFADIFRPPEWRGTFPSRFQPGRWVAPETRHADDARSELCSASANCLREVIDSFAKILRRCHSTVRGLRNSRAPTSGFDNPPRTNSAIWRSWGVNVSVADAPTVCLRTLSPVACSSRSARSAKASMPIVPNRSCAVCSCSRASRRRPCRRNHSPYNR
jgi:hypothetical protein